MNKLVMIPAAFIASTTAATRSRLPATSSPPSVVTSARFSGTRHTESGFSFNASSVISGVHAISRFNRVAIDSRNRHTSRSWM